ncbi:UDP-glucose 4-epimerase protein [Marine Group I thaumarchaeote SCGC RSA3]|uniref:UDP-glucose 4-epimerase protein n=2 Tax=Marine Group I TaxID=905826 RepID=A0A087RM40_9ARCH|nr:UDP-glucose 4-epimerase protein [Marine Group I thaumarchaeote SCGC AAA799-D11]KFM19938.1 UDP-glucose 4-epimerase protein [Marine Group I thaumarchaeote SCGC RSA3]
MKKFLVTGGAGFVGSHLSECLTKDGNQVVVLDDFSNGSKENLANVNNVEIISGSVTNIPDEISQQTFDGIFHLATHPRSFSLTNPLKDVEVNAKGMLNILEIAKKQNIKVVFTSNSGICGKPDFIPVDETHKNKPSTPYDANKLVSEYYCKIYSEIYKTKSIIFRLATVYGPRQKVNLDLGWRPVVATLTRDVFEGRNPTIFGSGEQTRDLIYVSDVVNGLIAGMNSSIDNAEMFLLSTNVETSINQLLELIFEVVGKKTPIDHKPENLGDIPRMCLSFNKVKNTLDFEPEIDLKNGVENYFNWLKEITNSRK